jgi:tetratricopeptide (TPR) repeat protein
MWYEAGRLHRRGDASILVQYLDATNSDDELVWLKWTKDHPDLASKLWPAVASVARQKLYIFVPDLIAATGRATDPDRFAKQLDGILASRFQRAGAAAGELGNHQQAVDYYSRSLELAPESAAVLLQRAESYQALGETARAGQDLRAAEAMPEG